jgi:hypothetical protein
MLQSFSSSFLVVPKLRDSNFNVCSFSVTLKIADTTPFFLCTAAPKHMSFLKWPFSVERNVWDLVSKIQHHQNLNYKVVRMVCTPYRISK